PASLGLRLVVAPLDLFRDRPRSGARVRLQDGEPAAREIAALVDIEALQLRHRRPAEVLHAHAGKVEPRGRNAQDVGWSHADVLRRADLGKHVQGAAAPRATRNPARGRPSGHRWGSGPDEGFPQGESLWAGPL